MLNKELLTIICCPKCKADLMYDERQSTLTCTMCRIVYEIKDGIPILLPPNDGK